MLYRNKPSRLSIFSLFLVLTIWLYSAVNLQADDFPPLTIPPIGPVRIPAEFEPMQAIIINSFRQRDKMEEVFLSDVCEDVNLIVMCDTERQIDNSKTACTKWGIDIDKCTFILGPFMATPRDGFPWFMFVDNNEPAFVYNQYCAEPNCVSRNTILYGLEQGYSVHRSGLNVDGGNFMTDGQGTAVSLDGVYLDNSDLLEDPNDIIGQYWGVHTYHFIPNDEYYPNGYLHIDCLAKYLSPDTIMVARVPSTDANYEQSEATAAYFSRQISCYGTPYHIVRVDIPDREPYVNSLIVNHKVYIPIMDRPADVNAIASYQAAMPGYEIVGISNPLGDGLSMWLPFWALHCDTMGIADEQMIYIEHVPVLDCPATAEGYPIIAKIVAYSGQPFIEGTPTVRWKIEGHENWNDLPLTQRDDLGDDKYAAMIPTQPIGTVIQYYLHAKDASGRSENHPYIGAPQAHTFTVKPFGANVSAISTSKGGTINFYFNAGTDNAQEDYNIQTTLTIKDPNTLPEELPETLVFTDFQGSLDDSGFASAELFLPETLPADWVEGVLHFDFILEQLQERVVDRVTIQILE